MFETIGAPELIIIGLVLVLLFGVGKIGHLGKDLGEGVKEFRRAMKEEEPTPEATVMTQPPASYIAGVAVPVEPQPTYAPPYQQPVYQQPVYAPQPAPQQPAPASPPSAQIF